MRHCRMAVVVPISKRGTVTLPPALRRRLGLDTENPLVIIEERGGELILRPAVAIAVRDIPEGVIAGCDVKGIRLAGVDEALEVRT